MAGKNLLVNGKNNITARANAMANIQADMANRTTASNVNATPNLPTPTRPTTLNLQKAQTSINTKLNNLNNATMPTGTITTNNPAFVNGQLTNQNTPSRFIGFQKPKTDLGGNLTQEGIKSLQPKGQNFNDLLKPTLYIPTEAKNVANETAKNSKEYKANENLIKKFHYAVKNANGQLTADDIKKQFKEWNKNVDAALQLQADIRPLVQKGQFADMNQISEFYSELLPKQKQADTTKLKEQEEMNKNLTELSAKADKILSRYNTLSNNGVKVLEDYKQLSEYADYLKKNYRLVGDNITDADIINFAKESIPEVKQLVDEIQQLEMNFNLTEEDRNVLYENGFDIGDWLLQAGADIQDFTQNNQLANYLRNNSAKRSSQLKDLGFNASSADTLGNLPSKALSIGSIPVNMLGELAGGVGQVDTALERIAKQQNRNEDGTVDTNGVMRDIVMGGGGAMTVGWNTVMAIPTAIYNLANETEVGAALTDTTIGNADRGLDKLLSGKTLKGIGLDDNAIAEWYNNQDEQTQAEARKILLTAIFHKGSKGIGKLKKLGNFEMNAVSEALNDLSKQKVSIETNSPTFKAKVEQGLADGLMKISDDGILTDKNGNNIGKVKVKKMTTGEKTRYVVDRIISINRAAWNARSLGELNPNALPDNRTIKEKAQSQINQAKENITEGIEGVKEGVNNIVDTTKQGIKKAKNVANRIEIAPGKVGEVFDNMKNKVTSKKPTSQKSEMQEQQQGLKEQSLEQEQAGQNNGELKITNDTQKIGKSKTGGTLSEKVYDKLTGLDEATRERMKANPYSAEENKNLIDTMESDTAFDFNEYQTNRYQNVLDTIVDKLEQKENTRKNEVGPLYQKLEETNAPIDTTNIKNQSTKFRDKAAENDGIISSSEQTKINKLLDAIDSLGDGTTDIWKIRRMADQWAKWDTESTTDGIRLIREIRDAIDDEIRVQRPEMKEVDTEYRRIKDEIADLRGNLINKKSGKLRDNAVSTVKNLLNPSNKQFLDRLEKEIPGITKQLQAIRDSKFVYNAYQTGNGSRFISGIARGTLGNMFKAVGVVTGGIPGLLFGALLDKAVDTALVSLTRKALKATITEMTPKAQAELESIMKKVQEGKELTAKEKAKLNEIENKIVENAENAKKTKAEQEAWNDFLDKVRKDQKSLKLPNKGGTDGGKNILTNGKTIITDAKGNSKVKGQILEVDNRVKKSDTSSSDDTTPPSGGTPTGTNPTNNGGTTTQTTTKKTEKKNKVTSEQVTSELQELADKNGLLEYDGNTFTYRYSGSSYYTQEGNPVMEGENIKILRKYQGGIILDKHLKKAFENGFSFEINGKTINKDNYGQAVNDEDDLVFYTGRKQSYGTDLDYAGRIPLQDFLKKYGKEIQRLQSVDNGKNTSIIGTNNTLTTNNTTNATNNGGENEQGIGGGTEISRGAVNSKISDSQSSESRSNIQEQSYSNGERYANTSMNTDSILGDGSRTGGTQPVLSRAEQRKVNQDARSILEKHGFSQNRIDYSPDELATLFKFEGNGGLANAEDEDIKGSRYEFYTPEAPTSALQRGIQKYSDHPITKIIDPTGGKGNLFNGIADTIEKEMYEINKVSGTIAKLRFPEMTVHIGETDGDYQNRFKDFMGKPTKTPTNGSLNASAIIGNPPFGNRIKARDDKDIKRLEEYFVKRPIEVDLQDGGVAGYVMPSTWLRGKDNAGKKRLAENTEIVDAYRLPAGVFSYTDVGTDLIIIKKVKPEKKSDFFYDNNYFKKHPEKVLGEEKTRLRGFGEEIYVEGDPKVVDTLWNDTPTKQTVVETPKNKVTSNENTKITTAPQEVEVQEPQGEFKPNEKPKNAVTSKPKKANTVKQWKKQPKITVYKGDKTDTGTYTFGDTEQLKVMEAINPDGYVEPSKIGTTLEQVKQGVKGVNYIDGKVQPDFLYFAGDIYEKLDLLEKDKEGMSDAQYQKQKDGLKAVMPPRRSLQDIEFSVLDEQLMATETNQIETRNMRNPETGRWEDTNVKLTIDDLFWKYMTGDGPSWSSRYKRDGIFQGTGTNPQNVRDYYTGRKNMKKEDQGPAKERADVLFNDFIKNSLPDEEKQALEDKYNKDYVAVVRPNYEDMPIQVKDMSATFHGQPLNLSPIQWLGVKAMVSKGSMNIAHGVGYGKTLEGVTATEIVLQRGWVKRPLLIVPKGTKKDWIKTYNEAFPNREVVDLGGLLKADIKRLTDEFGADPRNWLKDGQVGILTHSGFERNLSFKKAWIDELTRGLRDVMESKDESGNKKKKSARKQDEEQEKLEATAEETAETKSRNSKAMIALAKYNPDGLKDLTNRYEDWTYEEFKQQFKDRFTKEKVGDEEQGYFDNPYKIDVAEDIMNADIDAMWSMRPVYVEDLGIDHIVVDEVHNFKNIFKSAETEKNEDGNRVRDNRFGNVQGSSSARGRKMYSLTQYILQNNGGRGVFSLSATPFNNQALEVYNILSLHAYNRLLEMGIRNINDFFGKFSDFKEDLVAKANGTFEFKDIMVSFKNVRELQRLLLEYMDYRADNPDLVRPESVVKKVELDMSDLQQDVQDGIEAQLNDEQALKDNPGLMLKLIGQMRLNLISPYLTENYKDIIPTRQELIASSPKLKFSLDTIKRLRDEGNNDGVFIYMPYMGKDGVLHNVLKEAIENYVGADRVNVGIINGKTTGSVKDEDGESIDKKTAIANEFRSGKLNVLIGGENTVEGINLQDEGYITIDLLLGWNPTLTTQLFGRVWRQGNLRNHTIQLLPLIRNSGDIVMLQKFLEKSSRINDLLSFQGTLFNVEDLDSNEERLALLTDINKKADLQILLDDKKYQKEDQKLVSQEEQIQKVLDKEVKDDDLQRVQERVDKLAEEVEKYKTALDAIPEDNPAYRSVKSDLDNAKYRLETERKDLRKLKEQKKYVDTKLQQYNVNSIEELRQKLQEIGQQRQDIVNLRAGLKESRPQVVQKLREERDEQMKNQKSYDEYLDDMSYLFKQKKKFGTRAELKAWLEKNKIDRPSDTRNAVTSNNMNKITSK